MAALQQQAAPPSAPSRPVGADGIPEAARRRTTTIRQTFLACAIGAALLAILASPDLPSWADGLNDGPLTPLLREVVIGWQQDVARLDLAAPHQALRRTVEQLKEAEWPWYSHSF